jgi:multidrug efflux pump subunit AcrA (membrane-fusion protein)
VIAVLTISRDCSRPLFSHQEVQTIAAVATHLAPVLKRFTLQREFADALESTAFAATGETRGCFRAEAIEHYYSSNQHQGDVLRVNPDWVQRLYQIMLIMVVCAVTFMTIVRVRSFAEGSAVIRTNGRTMVTSTAVGTVTEIAVKRGQHVEAGQTLARLNDVEKVVSAERFEEELKKWLSASVSDPGNGALRKRVDEARVQRDRAYAGMTERVIRAPQTGFIDDVRIRVGQFLSPNEQIASIVDDLSKFVISSRECQ